MSEDGTPWIAFAQMCLGIPGNPNCPDRFGTTGGGDPDAGSDPENGGTNGRYFAILGRLVHSNSTEGDVDGRGNGDDTDQK
jgi:hypothetical protein